MQDRIRVGSEKKLYFVFASLDQKNIFLKEIKREKGPKSIEKLQNSFASDFTKNAKLEDTKRGKGSNFLSFLAPGGGDGT